MARILYLGQLDPISLSDLRIISKFISPNDSVTFMGYDFHYEKASLADRTALAKILLTDYRTFMELSIRRPQIDNKMLPFRSLKDLEKVDFDKILIPYEDLPVLTRFSGVESLFKAKDVFLVANYDKMPEYLYNKILYPDYVKGVIPNHIPCGKIRDGACLDITPEMADYMINKNLYFFPYLKNMMKESRFNHAVEVAKTAYEIAIRNGIDSRKAYEAGLFHDCGKDIDQYLQMTILKKHFIADLPMPEFAYHQFVGSYLAYDCFGVEDPEILSAICYHCTGKANMSPLEKCIYAADKVEPTRNFPTEVGREAVYKDLETGFVTVLKEQEKYFASLGINEREADLTDEMYKSLGL